MWTVAQSIGDSRRMLDAVGSGDTKKALEAVRDRLIVELDQAPSRYVAGLARELLAVVKALQQLPSDRPHRSVADELIARREERLTARGEAPVQRYGGRQKEEYPPAVGETEDVVVRAEI
jgi:hypothetical protein